MSALSSILSRQAPDLDGPSIPAPDGQIPQLDNPPNGNYIAIPFITVSVIVSALLFLIRFYAKYLSKRLTLSDYLTFFAFPIFWVYIYYSYSLSWTGGYLVHQWDIRLKDTAAFNLITFVATLLYVWNIALIKCAILLEWIEIFVPRGERNSFTWAAWATCFSFASLSLIIFILDLANCTPFEGNWNLLVPGRKCRFEVPQFVLAISTTNFILDLIPLILVQKVIWGLRLTWHKKLGVSFMFLTGLAAVAANAVRIYYASRFYVSNDVSYYFSILAISSLAETLAANLVLCVPFVPKGMLGLRQSKTYTVLRGYMTVKSDTTASNQSDAYYNSSELRPIRKPREHWFMSSKLDTTQTAIGTVHDNVQESESQRRLRFSMTQTPE
ncbi:hypothetical protein F5B22DRAFT_397823 [Xylaria bambusicola]|uniref:uncharacterized protein n=1 Tax=Xylaria bambusicola TaxID=326684 RepID=UPI0020074024|nr:uncharacterized protein F5B22DRAFT_397823 [Xylaria bambusicola]KAI0508463.1 hypothetical protein F5B22DRAFT_397823 [Xylaria bambusicola]